MKTPHQMYADAFKQLSDATYSKKAEDKTLAKNYSSKQSLAGFSSTGSLGGNINCEKLLMISKGMTMKVFTKLDDYFLGPT